MNDPDVQLSSAYRRQNLFRLCHQRLSRLWCKWRTILPRTTRKAFNHAILFAARGELPATRTDPVPIYGFDPFRRPCRAACGCRTQPLLLVDCTGSGGSPAGAPPESRRSTSDRRSEVLRRDSGEITLGGWGADAGAGHYWSTGPTVNMLAGANPNGRADLRHPVAGNVKLGNVAPAVSRRWQQPQEGEVLHSADASPGRARRAGEGPRPCCRR